MEFSSGEDRVERGFRVRERNDMRDRNGSMLSEECGYSDICVWGGVNSQYLRGQQTTNETAKANVDLEQ